MQLDTTLVTAQRQLSPAPPYTGMLLDDALHTAVVQTVAYSDVFDYPLTAPEIHRYLIGVAAPFDAVRKTLDDEARSRGRLVQAQGYFMLPKRAALATIRQQREAQACRLWPVAWRYGQQIGALPFVRMVAVTGSLAVSNADAQADIDYLIITEPRRLWLCRALVILLVRMAACQGVQLCPNYLLSADALVFGAQNHYVARELTQMVPITGREVYRRIRHLNRWTERFLPNAHGAPTPIFTPVHAATRQALPDWLRQGSEVLLRTPLGDRLEAWEMKRKITKFQSRYPPTRQDASEIAFSADCCKGHFDNHAPQILHRYQDRLKQMGVYDQPVGQP